MNEAVHKSFYYPDQKGRPSHRMCASGQRRAAAEAWNIIVPGGGIGKEQSLSRAVRAANRLATGADDNKHNIISFVVVNLATTEGLEGYVDPAGNYTLETGNGRRWSRSILEDAANGKPIF